ncbi:MAG TPA: hypothetical protein VGQ99_19850 [Tepidisphaeraceae bacterium]|jgi:uncharacterized membrane protein|nr:hypothetical protein [Tepidisphaeraceae bacterium]
MDVVLSVVLRWLHIIPAALVIGGLVFMRYILPVGLEPLAEDQREQVFLRCRRVFKIVVHASILFLLISGLINSIRLFPLYRPPLGHALWGCHFLLGAIVMVISFWSLAGKQPPRSHRAAATLNVVLLLSLVAVASTLKWAREKNISQSPPATGTAR